MSRFAVLLGSAKYQRSPLAFNANRWAVTVLALAVGGCSDTNAPGWECADNGEGVGSWTQMPLPPAGVGAKHPAFAWSGNELFVWGGTSYLTEVGTCQPCGNGARFDPQTDAWRPLATERQPTPRSWSSGVWADDLFVIWGGLPEFAQRPSVADHIGGAYDSNADSWRAMSTLNQPEWRWQHVGVWTGSEVIVWGGVSSQNAQLRTGGAWDPRANRWRTVSDIGAPQATVGVASAWTGRELLIWGGSADGESRSGSGAAYDPQKDTWRPISNVRAPSARLTPPTIWTGSEMIIYGGGADGGAAYGPATDSWRTVSSTGGPGPRGGGGAVWSGSQMFIWGNSSCQVGAGYNPTTNNWTQMSTAGPIARGDSSLVWAGTELLVYGGTSGVGEIQSNTVTGWRYAP